MTCVKILCVALVASLLVLDVTARAALGYGRGPVGGRFNGGGGGGGGHGAAADGPPRPYNFQYNVLDAPSGNDFGQSENSDGNNVQGEYYVVLPDGRRQTVKYTANDATGYIADVQYSGGGGGGTYSAPTGGYGGGRPGNSYLPPGGK